MPKFVTKDDNGQAGGRMGSHIILSYFILTLIPHDEKNFLTSSLSLWALRRDALFRKTLLLVDLLTTITIFFNKTCFINKNILEITNKFIPLNQTNF